MYSNCFILVNITINKSFCLNIFMENKWEFSDWARIEEFEKRDSILHKEAEFVLEISLEIIGRIQVHAHSCKHNEP